MAWMLGVSILAIFLLVALYRRSIRQNSHLTNYALLLLLDDSVHAVQKRGLQELVASLDATGASELGGKVNLAVSNLADRLSHTMLGVAGMLWKLHEQSMRRDAANSPSTDA